MLTLYRGDADKIKEFKLKKTNKFCLLGQGIYLTDSLRIANSYRTKGTNRLSSHVLFHGEADNRLDAFEKGFSNFCDRNWTSEHGYSKRYSRATQSEQNRHEAKCKDMYQQLIQSKEIKAEYTATPILTSANFLKPSQVIARNKDAISKSTRSIKVTWNENLDEGYVTRFEFNEQEFSPFVFNVDKACNDDFFWTLMYEQKLPVGEQAETLEAYIRLNNGKKLYNAVNGPVKRETKAVWRKIANVIAPYGFIGYEYSGGLRLGGGGIHRAFSIWDEEFVNDHKVARFK